MLAYTVNRYRRSAKLISDMLELTDVAPPSVMSKDQVYIRHTHIGISFDDLGFIRNDTLVTDNSTNNFITPGFSGVAEIVKIGSNVKGFQIGQKVCYPFALPGSFAEKRIVHHSLLIAVPPELKEIEVAAAIRHCLTGSYLLYSVMKIAKDSVVLIHSVAGGVGHFLAQWARASGLKVIGTIGHEEKRAYAQEICDLVINRGTESVKEKVKDFTQGKGVAIVYDGIGQEVFNASIDCLTTFGTYVSYGQSGAPLLPINSELIEQKSLFFTRPRLEMYKNNRMDLILSCDQMFSSIIKGFIKPRYKEYNFNDIPQACNDLASGLTTGCMVASL